MELRHLRYFVAIAEEHGFRRAAERLHVSQSPLSRQMKDLERELGIELFEPDGRGVKLTNAGKAFAERARSILADVDAAVEEARGVAEGRLGTLVIGFETGTAFAGGFLNVVTALRARAPLVGFRLVPMSSVEQWEALREGTITFGFGAYPPGDDDRLDHLTVARQRLGLLLSPRHRLARLPGVRLRDIEGERVLLQPRQLYPRLHADILAAARARGVVIELAVDVNDLEAIVALVAIGDAVTFVPETFSDSAAQVSLLWRPVDDLPIQLSEVLTWRSTDTRSPAVRAMIDSAEALIGPTTDPARAAAPTGGDR